MGLKDFAFFLDVYVHEILGKLGIRCNDFLWKGEKQEDSKARTLLVLFKFC